MSETIHFEGKFKGNREVVPHCTRWALRPKFGITTTDQTKVSCTRCAKQLGITPAAKTKPANLGTCPCCFNEQKTLKGAKMVHHGYQRPGYGWIVGDCFGVKYPRYEDSCEGTVAYQNVLKGMLTNKQKHLTSLPARTELTTFINVKMVDASGNPIRDRYYMQMKKPVSVTIKLGDVAKTVKDDGVTPGEGFNRNDNHSVPSFADLMKREVFDTERTIAQLMAAISDLQTKIDGWVKV